MKHWLDAEFDQLNLMTQPVGGWEMSEKKGRSWGFLPMSVAIDPSISNRALQQYTSTYTCIYYGVFCSLIQTFVSDSFVSCILYRSADPLESISVGYNLSFKICYIITGDQGNCVKCWMSTERLRQKKKEVLDRETGMVLNVKPTTTASTTTTSTTTINRTSPYVQ